LLIAPAALLICLVFGVPLVWTVYLSLHHYSYGITGGSYVGLQNYKFALVEDLTFWGSVETTVIFTVVSVVIEYIFALLIAVLLSRHLRFKALFRTAFVLPWAVPPVIAAIVWIGMYDPATGALNQVLGDLRIISQPLSWLTNPNYVLYSVIGVEVWKSSPFMIMGLLAGLKTIPNEVYEAAQIDGAGPFGIFRRITFPLLLPITAGVVCLGVIWRAKAFDVIWVLTQGGPGESTNTLAINAYRQMVIDGNTGLASAISILLALPLLLLIVVAVRKVLES
jgi:multiple sugar transport system permease protein